MCMVHSLHKSNNLGLGYVTFHGIVASDQVKNAKHKKLEIHYLLLSKIYMVKLQYFITIKLISVT